jgi:hypothetical protein
LNLPMADGFEHRVEPAPQLFGIGTPRSDLERGNTPPQPSLVVMEVDGEGNIPETTTYHANTRLLDGRPALLIDPGSVGNLCGDAWAKSVASAAVRHGHEPSYQKRPRPLNVKGVGNGSQQCSYDCTLPIAMRNLNGEAVTGGTLITPSISGSDVPGLLGLTSLRKNRAILDCNTMQLHFCGPGDYDLPSTLPPGTDSFQLELAPSGHLVLPCCEYGSSSQASDSSLTLVTGSPARRRCPPPAPQQPPPLVPAATADVPPPPGFSSL